MIKTCSGIAAQDIQKFAYSNGNPRSCGSDFLDIVLRIVTHLQQNASGVVPFLFERTKNSRNFHLALDHELFLK